MLSINMIRGSLLNNFPELSGLLVKNSYVFIKDVIKRKALVQLRHSNQWRKKIIGAIKTHICPQNHLQNESTSTYIIYIYIYI